MPPNGLNPVIPQILAQGLLLLRSQCVLPRLVNNSYGNDARKKGSKVEVPIAPRIASRDVVPGVTPPAADGIVFGKVEVPLDQWREAPFTMTDAEKAQVMAGSLPMAASSAIRTLAGDINAYLFRKLYQRSFQLAGTPGTTPFSAATGTAAYSTARTSLNKHNVGLDSRFVVLDPDAEGAALELAAFKDADKRGDQGGIIKGTIGEKMGALWLMDQQVPTHAKGTWGTTPLVNGAHAAGKGSRYDGDGSGLFEDGSGTLAVDGLTANTGTVKAGDLVQLAGGTEYYSVVSDATADSGGAATLRIFPAVTRAVADNAAITVVASHVVNLLFQKEALAFATRPLIDETEGLAVVQSMTDPRSGLTLRLEISRQHKQTAWSFDVLYGAENVRPEAVARIAG